MSVNGITSTQAAYQSYKSNSTTKTDTTDKSKTQDTVADTGAVYEPSNAQEADSAKKTYKADTNLVNKLKADAEARTSQLRSLVEKMMTNQVNTYGKAKDIWSYLAKGDFTVDAATKAQAQKDIADDGYWGVDQTSSRIIDFASALTGGNPDKIEEMRSAFQKGYEKAEKTWGGNLPDISKRTYEAVMKKFDELAQSAQKAAQTIS